MPIVFGILTGVLTLSGLIFWGLESWLGWTAALAVYFVGTCVLLILVVLMQKPKQMAL